MLYIDTICGASKSIKIFWEDWSKKKKKLVTYNAALSARDCNEMTDEYFTLFYNEPIVQSLTFILCICAFRHLMSVVTCIDDINTIILCNSVALLTSVDFYCINSNRFYKSENGSIDIRDWLSIVQEQCDLLDMSLKIYVLSVILSKPANSFNCLAKLHVFCTHKHCIHIQFPGCTRTFMSSNFLALDI